MHSLTFLWELEKFATYVEFLPYAEIGKQKKQNQYETGQNYVTHIHKYYIYIYIYMGCVNGHTTVCHLVLCQYLVNFINFRVSII